MTSVQPHPRPRRAAGRTNGAARRCPGHRHHRPLCSAGQSRLRRAAQLCSGLRDHADPAQQHDRDLRAGLAQRVPWRGGDSRGHDDCHPCPGDGPRCRERERPARGAAGHGRCHYGDLHTSLRRADASDRPVPPRPHCPHHALSGRCGLPRQLWRLAYRVGPESDDGNRDAGRGGRPDCHRRRADEPDPGPRPCWRAASVHAVCRRCPFGPGPACRGDARLLHRHCSTRPLARRCARDWPAARDPDANPSRLSRPKPDPADRLVRGRRHQPDHRGGRLSERHRLRAECRRDRDGRTGRREHRRRGTCDRRDQHRRGSVWRIHRLHRL